MKPGQNLTDIAIQEYGSSSLQFLIAKMNDLQIGAPIEVGQEIEIDDNKVVYSLSRYFDRSIVCATGATGATQQDNGQDDFNNDFNNDFL